MAQKTQDGIPPNDTLFFDKMLGRGNKIYISLRCIDCRKEALETMFAREFPGEFVDIKSIPLHDDRQARMTKMHHLQVEFEPKGRGREYVTSFFLALQAARVDGLDRGLVANAFDRLSPAVRAGGRSADAGGAIIRNNAENASDEKTPVGGNLAESNAGGVSGQSALVVEASAEQGTGRASGHSTRIDGQRQNSSWAGISHF